jgi:diacylglycerol kinase
MIKKYLGRFPHALNGLKYAIKNDYGFRTQIYLGATLAFVVGVWFTPISSLEVLLVVLAYTLVLITELQNSAVETALDKIHPYLDEKIKKTKDMAAAAVLVAGFFLLFTLCLIYFVGI